MELRGRQRRLKSGSQESNREYPAKMGTRRKLTTVLRPCVGMRTPARDLRDIGQTTVAKKAPTKQPEFREVRFNSGSTVRAHPRDWEIILELRK